MHFGITINKEEDKAYKDGKEYQGTYTSYFKQSYTYKSGDYAPENYLLEKYSENSKYNSLKKKSAGNTLQGSGYGIKMLEDEEIITKLIFDGTTEKENYVKSYWLASPGFMLDSNGIYFGPGGVWKGGACSGTIRSFDSIIHWYAHESAVRPIVSLRAKVTTEDIQKCDGTEEEWTGVKWVETVESGNINYGKIP